MTDFRDAFRALRATPLVSAVAILSLALGLGANTAMFSIVDALVLRALPVRYADRLALLIVGSDVNYGRSQTNPIWEAIRARPSLSDGAFAWGTIRLDLSERGEVDPVDVLRASGRMFEVLGVGAMLGRTFDEGDDQRGSPKGAVAVVSYDFWQRRLGGAADVVGRTLVVERVPFSIIGVTGPRFFGPEVGRTFDVAIPLGAIPLFAGSRTQLDSRDSWWLQVMFRLAPNQTAEQLTAAIRGVQRQIAEETRPANQRAEDLSAHLAEPFTLRPASSGSELRRNYERPVFALLTIVALTLLIACGNIANLLLARATARRHELSVRTALGASAWRLARQLLAESVLLSSIGAALGILFAFWGSRLIVSQISTTANRVFLDVGIDWRMLVFTGVISVGTALLFGVAPAFRAARVAPIEAMKGGAQGRGVSSGRRVGLAGSLVSAQVALSLMLLIGAGLFIRTFTTLANLDLGFERDQTLIASIGSQRAGLDSSARAATYEQVLQTARTIPGVTRAAIAVTLPVGDNTLIRRMEFPGRPAFPEPERTVLRNFVTPEFFATLGTPLVAGRDFDQRDRLGTARTVIVNRAFVTKYFDGENPIGRVILESRDPASDPSPLEIVGIVGDAVYRTLRDPAPPTMYWALAQLKRPPSVVKLVVRVAAGPPQLLAKSIVAKVAQVNPELTLTFQSLADQVNGSIVRERLVAKLAAFFGGLALLLAALGLYGITSYAVKRRHVELGIRMALGSSPLRVVQLVLSRTAMLVGIGVTIGGTASWWASKSIETLLFGLPPRDPATIAGAIVVLGAVAGVAAWLPARRAARVEPSIALRSD